MVKQMYRQLKSEDKKLKVYINEDIKLEGHDTKYFGDVEGRIVYKISNGIDTEEFEYEWEEIFKDITKGYSIAEFEEAITKLRHKVESHIECEVYFVKVDSLINGKDLSEIQIYIDKIEIRKGKYMDKDALEGIVDSLDMDELDKRVYEECESIREYYPLCNVPIVEGEINAITGKFNITVTDEVMEESIKEMGEEVEVDCIRVFRIKINEEEFRYNYYETLESYKMKYVFNRDDVQKQIEELCCER